MQQAESGRRQLLYGQEVGMDATTVKLTFSLTAVFIAIVLHEVAHGYAAYLCGDDTAKRAGRLSLNPLRHVDPFGTVFLPLVLVWSGTGFLFGWAKPVPVNFCRLGKWPRDMIIVSGAGIAVNFLLALLSVALIRAADYLPDAVVVFALYFGLANLVLAFFNLLPIPPLDGSKLFFGWVRQPWAQKYVNAGRYGMAALVVLIVVIPMIGAAFGFNMPDPLGWYISQCLSWFGKLVG